MWKKLLVTFIAFISTIGVVFALNQRLQAATENTIPLKKSDKVYLGEYEGNILGWDVIKADNNEALLGTNVVLKNVQKCNANTQNTVYTKGIAFCAYKSSSSNVNEDSGLYKEGEILNRGFEDYEKQIINLKNQYDGEYAFVPTTIDVKKNGNFRIDEKEGTVGYGKSPVTVVWLRDYLTDSNNTIKLANNAVQLNQHSGSYDGYRDSTGVAPSSLFQCGWGRLMNEGAYGVYGYRPWMFLNNGKIVMALDVTYDQSTLHTITPSNSTIGDQTLDGVKKIRYYDSTYNATLNSLNINETALINDEISKGEILNVNVSSNVNDDAYVSALLYDSSNVLKYYKVLGKTNTSGKYALDTSDLPTGNYSIAVVSEEISAVKGNRPSSASKISSQLGFTVVEPLEMTYTPVYGQGAITASTHEYSKNVVENNIVGNVSLSKGVAPYSLELISDEVGSEDYKNFILSATTNITGDVDIQVNPNAPNLDDVTKSLTVKDGGYKFCVAAVDANGHPVDVDGNKTLKQCVTLTVNKTTPTLEYTIPAKTDMKIGSADYIDTIKTSNSDLKLTTTAVPDFKLTGGTPGVLTVTKTADDVKGFTVEVVAQYTGTALPTTFKLETTLPETTNYKAVTTAIKKDIFVYKELSGLTWSGKTSYTTTDVVSGKEVGTLKAVDGVANFVYSLTTNADSGITGYVASDAVDNANFVIDATPTAAGRTMSVKTTSNLIEKTGGYKIQFKVKDDKGNVAFQKAIINVSAKNQLPINFRNEDGGSIITKKTIKFDSTTDAVFADGGSTSLDMKYAIAPDDEQHGGIKGSDYLSVDENTGVLTAKKVGTVVVVATRPGDATYGSISKNMDVVIEAAERTIAFGNVDDPRNIKIGSADLNELAIQSKIASTDTITYSSSDTSVVDIDVSGNLTIGIVGQATIKAEVVDSDGNYKTVSCEKAIKVFDGMSGSFTQGTVLQAGNTATTGKTVGSLSVAGGQATPTYNISTESGVKNVDAGLFNIDAAYGTLSLKSNVSASNLNGKYDAVKKLYILKVQVDVLDGGIKSTTVDCEITMKGANLSSVSFANAEGVATSKLSYAYSDGGSFNLSLVGNSGNGLPAYRLKDDASMPSDVVGPVVGNTITILNANDPTSNPKPVKVEAVIPANGGYDEKIIECEVEITKAEQSEFKFAKELIEIYPEGSITPAFVGKMSEGPVTLTSDDQSLVIIEGSDIKATKKEGSTTVKAVWKGNRNYKDGVATGNVSVTNAPAYAFEIRVPAFTYGDANAHADITTNGATPGATLTQLWSSSDESIATIDAQTGEITVKGAGYSTITCVQTSDKDSEVRASIQLFVRQKPISLKYKDYRIYTGEALPTLTLETDLVSGSLVGNDALSAFTLPINTISTAPDNMSKGSFKIQGSYSDIEKSRAVIKNYEVVILDGALEIVQDTPENPWLSVKGVNSGNTIDEGNWNKESIILQLENASGTVGTYDQISNDKATWNPSITVSKEGSNSVDVWFKKETNEHAGAISSNLTKTLKIDKTSPIIKSITGENVNIDDVARFMNTLSFGMFFKPGIEVEIVSEDPTTNSLQVSGLKEIRYKVFEVDPITKENGDTPIDEATISITAGGSIHLPQLDTGNYEVQAIAVDHAGNESAVKASRLLVKSWGESSDGDELSDINIDVNNDGIAEINITRPGEKKPYLNIDTTGDGLPDINISRDGEKVEAGVTQPYLNIIHPETPWNPTAKIDYDEDGTPDFRTDESLEAILSLDSNEDGIPDLNIDTDGDYIPNLNIDVNNDKKTPETNIDAKGEGVASINIDSNGDGTPELFIAIGYAWDPKDEVKSNGKTIYATVIGIKPDSKDSLVDGGVIVKPSDPNTSFLPNYALKVNDVTESITEQEKDMIVSNSGSKNGEVKIVFDVNLLEDNKVIQPNGKIQVSIPIDKTIKNPRLMMKGEDGTWNFIEAEEKDGYYVFDTDYIGSVSIIGDKEEVVKEDPIETPPSSKQDDNSSTSVKGNYMNGMGGAGTGDISNICLFIWTGGGSIMILGYIIMKFIKAPSVKK